MKSMRISISLFLALSLLIVPMMAWVGFYRWLGAWWTPAAERWAPILTLGFLGVGWIVGAVRMRLRKPISTLALGGAMYGALIGISRQFLPLLVNGETGPPLLAELLGAIWLSVQWTLFGLMLGAVGLLFQTIREARGTSSAQGDGAGRWTSANR